MGSKGNQVTTNQSQTYTPNPYIGGAAGSAIGMATQAAQSPFQQPIAPVAGFTPFQQQAFGETAAMQGMAQPFINTGAGYLAQSAAPVTGTDVANYYNPMAANVTAQMQNIFGQQQRNTTGQLTQAAGGVGADRIAVGQAELANQQGLAAGQTYAGLYQQALQAAEQQKQMMAGAGYGIAQMGPAALAARQNEINQLMGAGGMQQNLTQQQLNAIYQNQLARIAYPFQTAQYLAGITGGLAPAMGGTTTGQATTTYPTPSPLAQGLGLGIAGAGMVGSMGGFGGMSNFFGNLSGGMGGSYGTPLGTYEGNIYSPANPYGRNRGGAVPHYDDGGNVAGDILPPMGASPTGYPEPGAAPVRGSPIPTISLQPGAGKSGPSGQWMSIKDLPMPKSDSSGGGGGGAADAAKLAMQFLPMLMAQRGGAIDVLHPSDDGEQNQSSGLVSSPDMMSWLSRGIPTKATDFLTPLGVGLFTGKWGLPESSPITMLTSGKKLLPFQAQGGVVNPMAPWEGYQQGGELGEVFDPVAARFPTADESFKPYVPEPMEQNTGLNVPDPQPAPRGGLYALSGAEPPMAAQAAPAPMAPTAPAGGFGERWAGLSTTTNAATAPGVMGTTTLAKQPARDPYSAESPPLNPSQIKKEAIFAAQKYGVPVDMALRLVNQESGFQPRVTSSAGAYGPMQLMPGTAGELGVNRFNTYENIHGGMQYLRQMYDKFGNWNEAVAAYNAGPNRVASRTGLPGETRGYLAAIRPEDQAPMVPGKGNRLDMVAGPGAPSGPMGAAPEGQGQMGAGDFKEPYPDALNRDWGQRAVRSPWMSLVQAGARMASTVGPIGSVIGQGIAAGAGELEGQRKALQSEEAINLKAKALHDAAQYHLDVIAQRQENRLARLQALTGLHPAQLVALQARTDAILKEDMAYQTLPDDQKALKRNQVYENLVMQTAEALRKQQERPAAPAAAVATPAGTPPVSGAKWSPSTKMWYSPDGSQRWDSQGNPLS